VTFAVYVVGIAWLGYRLMEGDGFAGLVCWVVSILAGAIVADSFLLASPFLVAFLLMGVLFAGGTSAVGHDAADALLGLPFMAVTETLLLLVGMGVQRLWARTQRRRRYPRRREEWRNVSAQWSD